MKERKKILVIEDHDSIRLLLGNFLGKQYDVVTKADGYEGLLWLGSGNIPDCIILDLDMPRINGFEFLNNIRGSGFFRNIPVIIVSGEENPELQAKCREFGVSNFHTKPFNPLKLKQQLEATLQQKTTSRTGSTAL